jgi:hypothetical protein
MFAEATRSSGLTVGSGVIYAVRTVGYITRTNVNTRLNV